jgi:hypothetical protein
MWWQAVVWPICMLFLWNFREPREWLQTLPSEGNKGYRGPSYIPSAERNAVLTHQGAIGSHRKVHQCFQKPHMMLPAWGRESTPRFKCGPDGCLWLLLSTEGSRMKHQFSVFPPFGLTDVS